MYYHPTNQKYTVTQEVDKFLTPKNRHHDMLTAYTDGGKVLADASQGITGYVWKAFYQNGKIFIQREDQDEVHEITTRAGVTQLDLTIDQNMRPFLVYVANGLPYYYHFDATTSDYGEVALPAEIKFPRCELDTRTIEDIPMSDIIIGYTRAGNLCYRVQRERFTKENIITTDAKKTMLWRIGLLKDGRFGYQWR